MRARLVDKHLEAKYGGKDLHELFATVPPFEMAKLVLARAVTDTKSRSERLGKSAVLSHRADLGHRLMFIDVSKAYSTNRWAEIRRSTLTCHRSAGSRECAVSSSTGCMVCDLHHMGGGASTPSS